MTTEEKDAIDRAFFSEDGDEVLCAIAAKDDNDPERMHLRGCLALLAIGQPLDLVQARRYLVMSYRRGVKIASQNLATVYGLQLEMSAADGRLYRKLDEKRKFWSMIGRRTMGYAD